MSRANLVSERLRAVKPSATVALTDRARELAAGGREVLNLAAGEPDFLTAAPLRQAATDAMDAGFTHYTASAGIPELRRAIAAKLRRENGLEVDPAEGVLVLPGVKQGVAYACLAFLGPGDECLCPEPCWVSYRELVTLAGARYVPVPTRAEDGFELGAAALSALVTDQTRMIILNTPTNPTGRVFGPHQLEHVAEVARRHDLLVLADEIYEHIVFAGHRHLSVAGLPGMAERTLTLNGFSKAYAMTGWRLGFAAGPAELIRPLLVLQQHTATCPVSFVQKAAVVALEEGLSSRQEMVAAFDRRRRRLLQLLTGIPGLRILKPQGTFYMWLDVREGGLASAELAEWLLEKKGLILTPGDAFGDSGRGFLRLSFAAHDDQLERAAQLLRESFQELASRP
ncbi:MAG: pyridoxal phosphate-dependent aminotransferase [Candidatus Riflebacteria bacterium]|nr:pyridoxal phosphate-dependent aminotransferase [Candidatus Riflebacteria bacterium]